MDEADQIVECVQSIIEVYQVEFTSALAAMTPGKWTGVDADARARLARQTRESVSVSHAISKWPYARVLRSRTTSSFPLHCARLFLLSTQLISSMLQVNKVKDIFARVQTSIDAVPSVGTTKAELAAELEELVAAKARAVELNAILANEIQLRKATWTRADADVSSAVPDAGSA